MVFQYVRSEIVHCKTKVWNCTLQNRAQTWSMGGSGFPLQRMDKVHVAILSMESLECSFNWASSGMNAPLQRTRSRYLGESAAILPNAHTACISKWMLKKGHTHDLQLAKIHRRFMVSNSRYTCSRTSSLGEARSFTKIGTAPWSITTFVFSEVPEVMFVRAHAALNYTLQATF